MAKIKIPCPSCDQLLQCDETTRARKVKCPHCKQLMPIPQTAARARVLNWRSAKKMVPIAIGILLLVMFVIATSALFIHPPRVRWSDRRPIGALHLASDGHTSATNPRGWFNDPTLDVTGPDGPQRFRKALMEYTDRSLEILKRTDAQGVIVWDLEGEQFPHKISYIGDPRLLDRLAPEMAPVADEFFEKLRNAGLKVGVTVRPQQFVFKNGQPQQTQVLNTKKLLLDKIDFARSRWGATLFYIDSNGGIRRPDEVWQLRQLQEERPDILLIPEHDYLPYWAFSAPYVALRQGDETRTARWAQKRFPGSFHVLDVSDAANHLSAITAARLNGDILLFRAWWWTPECQLMENFANERK